MSDANQAHSEYSLTQYVSDVRAILQQESDPTVFTASIKPLAQRLASSDAMQDPAYRVCNEEQGFGAHLLHEDENHELAVLMFCWLPDRGTPPHNHETWAVVAVVEGEELETHFERKDDGSKAGYALLEKTGDEVMRTGDVSVCSSQGIHSVWNTTSTPSVSLHTYGKHINFTGRSYFDPENNTETPYLVTVED
jgi:predicted metal-dependent enzyme (double-stranded beta helix superfamily)